MRAVNADYAVIDGLQEQIACLLDEASDVHIACPAGTDLRLRVTGREALVDTDSLPHGEAYNAPLEESAEGVAVIEKAFFRGKFAAGLRLIFSGGRVTGAEAPDPAERRPSGTCWLLPAGIKM
jgi:leucyl aminopeptidase (aminopeptidase T)